MLCQVIIMSTLTAHSGMRSLIKLYLVLVHPVAMTLVVMYHLETNPGRIYRIVSMMALPINVYMCSDLLTRFDSHIETGITFTIFIDVGQW